MPAASGCTQDLGQYFPKQPSVMNNIYNNNNNIKHTAREKLLLELEMSCHATVKDTVPRAKVLLVIKCMIEIQEEKMLV